MRTRSHLAPFVAVLLASAASSQLPTLGQLTPGARGTGSHCSETLDFEGLAAGKIVGPVFAASGIGPVLVTGSSSSLPGLNAAVIFDSANPTGEDPDLGTPNQTFGGPGVGAAGQAGMPFENANPLGNVLILAEDLVDSDGDGLVDDPDDADLPGSTIEFDFSAISGGVVVQSLTVLDVEKDRSQPTIAFFDQGGAPLGTFILPQPGDNGVVVVSLGDLAGVSRAVFTLNGSGAIDDFCFGLDCNGNGIADDLDIAAGTSKDCNQNGIPDECEPDCDGDGIPDDCEEDCNQNGIPDDCEVFEDCNGNEIPDECDIASGTSTDLNGNGIPDECEEDCNGNGIPDDVDIASGTSKDCNSNGIPDECEPDCDGDGIPDDCEEDCNANGIPDDCEVFEDCNGND
ncbi:MAG: hypothetical protein AAF682_32465, partial [Planctomycetota bacterium]